MGGGGRDDPHLDCFISMHGKTILHQHDQIHDKATHHADALWMNLSSTSDSIPKASRITALLSYCSARHVAQDGNHVNSMHPQDTKQPLT